jgi:hypothetical protein
MKVLKLGENAKQKHNAEGSVALVNQVIITCSA